MKFNNRFTVLVMGISLLICGVLGHEYPGKKTHDAVLQQSYDREIAVVRTEHARISKLINAGRTVSFQELSVPTTYPYFIFANGKMIYWSCNNNIPRYQRDVAGAPAERLFEVDGDPSVLVRSSLANRYDIVSVVDLLRDKNYTTNFRLPDFNSAIFFLKPEKVSTNPFPGALEVRAPHGRPIFYTQIRDSLQHMSFKTSPISIILIVLGMLLVWNTIYMQSIKLSNRHQYLTAGVLMGFSFLVLRLLMRYFNIPWIFFPNKLIDVVYGNLFIDTLCALIILTKFSLAQYRALLYINIEGLRPFMRNVLSVLCVLFMFVLGRAVWWLIDYTYQESLIENHYSVSFYLSNVKDTMYVYLFILLGVYFLSTHSVANVYKRLQPEYRKGTFFWGLGTLTGMALTWWLNWGMIIASSSLFLLVVYLLRLPRYFYRLRSFTYVYYIIGAFAYTLILFYVLFQKDQQRSLREKENFAERYLNGKDQRLERQIYQMSAMFRKSGLFNQLLEGKATVPEVEEGVKESLYNSFLDHFLVTFEVFDSSGRELTPHKNHKLNDFRAQTLKASYPTEYPNLYLTRSSEETSYYTLYYEVSGPGTPPGTVLFRLYPNRSGNLNLKTLLQMKRVVHNPFTRYYSYGVFDSSGNLVYQYGNYNYNRLFNTDVANKLGVFQKEAMHKGYSHFARKGDGDKIIVVSEKKEFYKDMLANFSFLFFVSLIGVMGLLIFMGFFNDFKRYQMNLSGKIQLYLNGAFLLPLTIIMIIGAVIIKNMFSDIRDESMLSTSLNISEVLNIYGQNYDSGKFTRRDLRNNLDNLARSSSVDINLYDLNGTLFYSSSLPYQNLENPLYINPKAYSTIRDEGASVILLDDFQEKINFKTAFIPVKGLSNNLTCIAGINYIDAQTAVQSWTRQIWQTLLIAFLIIFFLLYTFSFVSSKRLTEPLKLIADKIKSVNFHERNKEIVWEAKDEIGLLTGEYNRMLRKLEESKQALSISEKQSAWRDMAKQLAHEIRNPLTPMMLQVQQLQRLVLSDHPDVKKRILRLLGSISDQIENITGISLSFSKFAEMPLPAHEEFDVVATVKSVPDLFRGNPEIHFNSTEEELWVRGDSKTIKRTVAYLIKSGVDSVPPNRKPVISISISKGKTSATIEIRDNGRGIPEEMQEKVFRPTFSEKDEEIGFGLSISKISIEHFGGNIWFESEDGKGKTFYIELLLRETDNWDNVATVNDKAIF